MKTLIGPWDGSRWAAWSRTCCRRPRRGTRSPPTADEEERASVACEEASVMMIQCPKAGGFIQDANREALAIPSWVRACYALFARLFRCFRMAATGRRLTSDGQALET